MKCTSKQKWREAMKQRGNEDTEKEVEKERGDEITA